MPDVRIEASWKERLAPVFEEAWFKELTDFVKQEYASTKVFPPPSQIFHAFELCPFDQVRVVLLGQDPYHGDGQAHGLCFSVPPGVRQPPSLQNIFKEIESDLGTPPPKDGNLERWATQGVFLLNATLTVRAHEAGSHQGKGWEQFTDHVIKLLSDEREHLVFLLWGRYAQAKEPLIDTSKHLVLKAAHPSPFSAYAGFFGCRHFSKTNAYLEANHKPSIAW